MAVDVNSFQLPVFIDKATSVSHIPQALAYDKRLVHTANQMRHDSTVMS